MAGSSVGFEDLGETTITPPFFFSLMLVSSLHGAKRKGHAPCLRVTLHPLAMVVCQDPSELVPMLVSKPDGLSACKEEAEWEG